ncbi:hypothetical protein BHF71_02205 [Vulcanibacillus modesticaldus]|uniref:Peptidase S8/S53 domain-containing protein n=1 Tax=Vulcanibacillus modesticaldus TaxID=337097 RepID=A0A1D2YUN0_9BACI|nr:S8 family peptidase [Vulcanibacillus modesticaldus]OEF99418.1 hypothetical protein BHF71_02205 [Vulcanibacillus modesticaldus]
MTPPPLFPPFDPRKRNHPGQREYINKILFVKPKVPPFRCYHDLINSKITNLKYLKKLNAFIGLFPKNSLAEQFRHHPDVFQIEDDIDVQIFIPFKGKIVPKTQMIPWGIERVGAQKAWYYSQGKGVRVGVIDTGIAFDHPDLERNIKGGVNIINPLLSPYDYNGHGTHVAGTIGAVNNEYGVVGVAPKVDLFAIKAFNKDGTAKLSDIIKAIDWSIENEMDIVNMSFGFNEPSPTFREAIIRAQQAGVLMIAASGNKGTRGRIEYPAQFDETIAVSSINEKNQISNFSTIGPQVDLAAPGEKIISTWPNNSFRELSGTSMAVAHVTGVAALILSRYRQLSTYELAEVLKSSAIRLKNISSFAQGAGVVNAAIAIRSP